MRVLQLFIEIIFIGSLAILAVNNLFPLPLLAFDALVENKIIFTFDFIILAWVVGFFINIFADIFFTPVYHRIEARWMLREGNPELVLERLRYDLYVKASSKEIIQRMEYHRSLIRLSRCILFGSLLYLVLALLSGIYYQAVLSVIVTFFAFFAYYRALIWSIKSTYYAWVSVKQNSCLSFPNPPGSENKINYSSPEIQHDGVQIVAFTGGTGFRDINMSLAQRAQNITRVVPIWDNGGSSKALRECFALMPVGDIRHALMTQAHGEGRVGSIVRLFNWRLSDSGDKKKLLDELESFVNNQHPLMKALDHILGNVIVNYLSRFYESLPRSMDLKNGSIGNFVLVGTYLAHNKDINTAIYVFRQLCSIQGNVWPISVANNLHIKTRLEDGNTVMGQSETTSIDRSKSHQRIKKISFSNDLSQQKNTQHIPIQANPMVLDALQKAEVVVFGPGSFFTSVLPHIKVDGIVDAISRLDGAKIFVGNLVEDNECYGYTLEDIIELFLTTCNQHAKIKRPANKYITHIIAHCSHTVTEYTHNDRHYLPPGKNIKRFNNDGISVIINDFENPWKRGAHDPGCIADYLISIDH
ncbi:MAG: 2-phospho-L-lactate transferase CofD family protein [Gammaproteobacteria bacterium]|nr:2-phospho-L-lactate transferase CofD family protein [Gammaproteobacteria bacterium]